ncbi:MAG: hypothetical protein A2052_02345 [Deltaproteobacteria bacterium GWA2_54_12]|nr:MAG: hypothetical protein A2052_02345 [Deltaproteobacteria bacterium GWA2_54_12]
MHLPVIDSPLVLIAALVIFILTATGVVLVLWIAMPFSMFGVKGHLKKMVEEQEKTNRLLEAVVESMRKESHAPAEMKEDNP